MAQTPTIPPTIDRVEPRGLRRGATTILTAEGWNLDEIQLVLFDAPGMVAKLLSVKDLPDEDKKPEPGSTERPRPMGKKQEARFEVTVPPTIETGVHQWRVRTPRGTSNLAFLDVGTLQEVLEKEPNDSIAESQRVEFPATIVGALGWVGDVDSFQFDGQAGQEVVFEVVASGLGSQLKSVLFLRDSTGKELAQAGYSASQADAVLTYKLTVNGRYTLSISDLAQRGGENFFYRLNAGTFPYLTEVFPLGLRAGQSVEVEVKGVNLGEVRKVKLEVPTSGEGWQPIPLRVQTRQGESLNKLWLAVGNEPEIMEREPNDSPTEAQPISVPVTINGRIWTSTNQEPVDEDYFRFQARKGQHLSIEVAAARLGSKLDSVVEVLDAQGRQIPRATIRCLTETVLSYPDMDTKEPAFSLVSITGLRPYDYLMIGDELLQITFLPDQADVRAEVKNFGGKRVPLLDTSPNNYLSRESQTETPVYKVRIFPAGEKLPPNGLPVYHLFWRNDDGGPGYGSDSRLEFIPPQDGEYLVHIKDARGLEGEDFAYRLSIREATPDFALTTRPTNPNVPRGGRVPVIVEADRRAGYDGPIEMQVKGLPPGVTARPATIPAGQDSTVVVLEAGPQASKAESAGEPFEIVGRAKVGDRVLIRVGDAGRPLKVVSVIPPPDVVVAVEPREVILGPKEEAAVTLHVERKNGFRGRVPCALVNLPPGVSVTNMGLNGVLVPENETSRTLTLRAEGWVQPIDQPVYVIGTVESSASTQHVSVHLTLRLRGKQEGATAPKAQPGH